MKRPSPGPSWPLGVSHSHRTFWVTSRAKKSPFVRRNPRRATASELLGHENITKGSAVNVRIRVGGVSQILGTVILQMAISICTSIATITTFNCHYCSEYCHNYCFTVAKITVIFATNTTSSSIVVVMRTALTL